MTSDFLLKGIDLALEKRRWHLRFDAALEARFERDTQAARNRHMVFAGLLAGLVYSLFLLNDYSVRPDAFDTAVILRLGVMMPFGLTVLWFVHRGMAGGWREAMMASTVVLAMVISCWVMHASSMPYSYLDALLFSFILVVGNLFYSLRFPYALGATTLSVAIMLYCVATYAPMPMDIKRLAVFAIVAKALFTLLASYRLEQSERLSYLLLLKETLRAGDFQRDNQQLTHLSQTDPLTGLANRRQLESMVELYWQRAMEKGIPLGVAIIDIDHFKAYNDAYGHLQGDQCLCRVARALRQHSRPGHLVARFGGEEFVVLMEDADESQAKQAGERLKEGVAALALDHQGVEHSCVTVSVGIAIATPGPLISTVRLFSTADQALYQAKREGRNRCRVVTLLP